MRHDDQQGSHSSDWMRDVLREHEGPLLRYATRLTGNLDTARDVVQDTFLKLYREKPQRFNSHLPEWLFTVCRNRALDGMRKESRLDPLPDELASTEPTPSAA